MCGLLLWFQIVTYYYPATIQSLAKSAHLHVQVTGTVTAMTFAHGQITFRLEDRGHAVSGVIGKDSLVRQPRLGIEVLVSGTRRVVTVPQQPPIILIDPVERIEPIERP